MIDTGFANMFYFYPTSVKPSVDCSYFTFSEEIDPQKLAEAAQTAVRRHFFFGLKPVLDDSGRVFFEQNREEVPIFADDGSRLELGTEQTGHYLFRILHSGNAVRFMFGHALADGRGMMAFVATLFYEYFRLCGEKMDPEGCVLTEDTVLDDTTRAKLLEDIPKDIAPRGMYQPKDPFMIPGERSLIDGVYSRVCHLEFDAKAFMDFVKTNEATPTAMLMALIARMCYQRYEVGNRSVCASIPVDMRARLGKNALSNYCSSAVVPFDPALAGKSCREQAKGVKAALQQQTENENLYNAMYPLMAYEPLFRGISLAEPAALEERIRARAKKEKQATPFTYIITNVGRLAIPGGVAARITDWEMIPPNTGGAPLLTLSSLGGRMKLGVSQNFPESDFAEGIVEALSEQGLSVTGGESYDFASDAIRPALFLQGQE